MKQIKTLLIASALFVGATSFTQAQSKVAHINTTELVQEMPEMKSAQTELQKLAKTYETEIQGMTKELQDKAKQYDEEAPTQTQEANEKRVVEIQGMEQSIRQYQQQAQQDIAKKEADLLRPILEKAKAAIEKVSRAQGYDYVLDASQGSGLIVSDGKDLKVDVKKELGF